MSENITGVLANSEATPTLVSTMEVVWQWMTYDANLFMTVIILFTIITTLGLIIQINVYPTINDRIHRFQKSEDTVESFAGMLGDYKNEEFIAFNDGSFEEWYTLYQKNTVNKKELNYEPLVLAVKHMCRTMKNKKEAYNLCKIVDEFPDNLFTCRAAKTVKLLSRKEIIDKCYDIKKPVKVKRVPMSVALSST
jgi:hypothetical protein